MQNEIESLKVWDPLVRIFHWGLAASFMTAYLLEDDFIKLHLLAGSIVLGLVLFRVIWGVIGTPHARFADFPCRPRQVLAHLHSLLHARGERYSGHTPAGSAMVLTLLTGLLLLSVVGVALYGFQEGHGPMAAIMAGASLDTGEQLETLHAFLADALMALVVLHLLGVATESVLLRENLARAMVTGRKSTKSVTQKEKLWFVI